MLTDLELTILSIVAEGARYGTELQHAIDERGLRDWLTIGEASTYYILAKLEKQDLLTSRQETGAPQDRTVFAITEAGRGVLQTAVNNLLREPRGFGAGLDLGLANLSVLKPSQVYQALKHRSVMLRAQLNAAQAAYLRAIEENASGADARRALYSHGIALMDAELAWLATFMADWKSRYPAVEHDGQAVPSSLDDEDSPHQQQTQIHRRTAPGNPAKQAQQINRKDLSPPNSSADK